MTDFICPPNKQSNPFHLINNNYDWTLKDSIKPGICGVTLETDFDFQFRNKIFNTKNYPQGLWGNLFRYYDENFWLHKLDSERFTAAGLSFIRGAITCLPKIKDGRLEKSIECGFDSAAHTIKEKPDPIRFDVSVYLSGSAFFSLIADF